MPYKRLSKNAYITQQRLEKFFAVYTIQRRRVGKIFGTSEEAEAWLLQITPEMFEELYKNRVVRKKSETE